MNEVLSNPASSKSKFLNWMKAALAVLFTKEEIEPVVYNEIESFQQESLQNIAKNNCLRSGSTCSNCSTENVIKCPTHKICNNYQGTCSYHRNDVTKYRQSGCPNKICHSLNSEIQRAHRYYGPSYKNTDTTQWCSNPWEIAKCYMPPDGYKDVTTAAETDFNGIISVIINHLRFDEKIHDDLSKKNNIFEMGREVGKAIRHSPNLEVEDEDLANYFTILNNILADSGFIAINKLPHNASEKLTQLQKGDLNIGKHLLSKVLDEAENAVPELIRKGIKRNKIETEERKLKLLDIIKTNLEVIEDKGYVSITQLNETLRFSFEALEAKVEQGKETIKDVIKEGVQTLNKEKENAVKEIMEAKNVEGNDTGASIYMSDETYQQREQEQSSVEQDNMPTLHPEDGNLIILNDFQLKRLIENCDKENVMEGRFGKVYTTKQKVPGLDIRVAIKEITCRSDDKYELLSTANEMIARRVFHFATVPLNAYIEKELLDGRRAFYFISPFLENGNLLDCIASDTKCQEIKLDKNKRKKILYQIASAIDYLHTEVTGFRGRVLHVDLSSNNVVLDKYWNARLIDFGLACELNEKQTEKTCTREFGKPGYRYTSVDSKLRIFDDYHNFGVVIREMLTGKPPTDGKKELRKQHPKDIEHSLLRTVWKPPDMKALSLLDLSQKCIESVKANKDDMKSSHIVKVMENLLGNQGRYSDHAKELGNLRKCTLCLVNEAVTGLNRVVPKCNKNINICVSCMRNSHINPITCPHCSEGTVYPKIGHTFAALLIAGNDTKEKAPAKSLKKEIEDIHGVLISKWPCVIGIREENVRVIAPRSPGDDEELLPRFDEAIKDIKKKTELETLIIYFTGHHDQNGFRLGKTSEYITFKHFQQSLKTICKSWGNSRTRVLAFLDCCNPPPMKDLLIEDETKLIQINVCSQLQKCSQPENGSFFKTFFIQALTRKFFNKKCYSMPTGNDGCDLCSISGKFVSVHSLHTYIAEHMGRGITKNQQPHLYVNGIKAEDAFIAYNVDFAIDPTIWFENEGEDPKKIRISPSIYPNFETLKDKIFENIIEQANIMQKESFKFIHDKLHDVLCIRIHNGSNEGKELTSMLELSSAMIGKREIAVSCRKVEQICNGKAVTFQPGNSVLRLIGEKNFSIHGIKDKVMVERVFKRIDELDKLITHLNSLTMEEEADTEAVDKNCLENIITCFKELTSIWRYEIEKNAAIKELKVGFPSKLDLIVFELADQKVD